MSSEHARGRLILIEGMIGAGKSTTAERLAARLTEDGDDVRAFSEFANDHPAARDTSIPFAPPLQRPRVRTTSANGMPSPTAAPAVLRASSLRARSYKTR